MSSRTFVLSGLRYGIENSVGTMRRYDREICVYLLMYSPLSTFLQALHLKQPRCH